MDGGFRNYHQLYNYISKEVCANWVEKLVSVAILTPRITNL